MVSRHHHPSSMLSPLRRSASPRRIYTGPEPEGRLVSARLGSAADIRVEGGRAVACANRMRAISGAQRNTSPRTGIRPAKLVLRGGRWDVIWAVRILPIKICLSERMDYRHGQHRKVKFVAERVTPCPPRPTAVKFIQHPVSGTSHVSPSIYEADTALHYTTLQYNTHTHTNQPAPHAAAPCVLEG